MGMSVLKEIPCKTIPTTPPDRSPKRKSEMGHLSRAKLLSHYLLGTAKKEGQLALDRCPMKSWSTSLSSFFFLLFFFISFVFFLSRQQFHQLRAWMVRHATVKRDRFAGWRPSDE